MDALQSLDADRARMGMIRDTIQWQIEQHVCAICFGRLLSRNSDHEGARIYCCPNCGEEREGASVRVLCSCGIKLRARSAGIRCAVNPNKSPEWPMEIVAVQNE